MEPFILIPCPEGSYASRSERLADLLESFRPPSLQLHKGRNDMILWVLRVVFILLAGSIGLTWTELDLPFLTYGYYWILPVTLLAAVVVIAADVLIKEKRIDTLSSIYFGIIVGLFLNFMAMLALEPYFNQLVSANETNGQAIRTAVSLTMGITLCYITTSFIVQTKDDFRFIVPYVQFSREVRGGCPYLLDTSVIIDGRIADVVQVGVIDNKLIVPNFVLIELQHIADSTDKIRRARGKRGLDVLSRMQSDKNIDLSIYDREHSEISNLSTDQRLVQLALQLEAKIVTNDQNLNKIAKLHQVKVVNLNDLANAMKSILLPGEKLATRIVRPGESAGQGVGYLDDGTMIVVDGARELIGKDVTASVTSVLQTSAGRMIFGPLDQVSPTKPTR
ncbi:MAG: PIN domain-containing protein [Pirellulaceae bacterium]|nr:PIN domain-containing protein [Pirellulaceae bacterium]